MATNEELINGIRSLIGRSMPVRRPSSRKILAYHGSPHDFDRFDSRHIGTGEGNQSYSHGLYFAGDEDVAIGYRDALTPNIGLPVPEPLNTEYINAVKRNAEISNKYGAFQRENPPVNGRYPDNPYLKEREAASALESELSRRIHATARHPGRIYQVELDVPERSMLDWDAPISQQPRQVKKLYGDLAMDRAGDGGRIYRDAVTRLGEEFDDDMTGALAARAASQEFLDAGIPGVRYFDGMSRSANTFPRQFGGKSTRNYVMFPGTEDQIRILRKYGVAAPITAGAGALQQDQ